MYQDKAGTAYWNNNWSASEKPLPLNPEDQGLDNYVNLELHAYFQKLLEGKRGFRVLEIGCANSIWPIYFHQYFDAKVAGLDYSPVGCEKSRALLTHYQVPGEIYCADLFEPPPELLGQFDLVISFGVVEHFKDTAACLKACSAFVKSGGYLFTLIPNMPSLVGWIQKYVDRSVYDIHVPLTLKAFRAAHQAAGLNMVQCDYFMAINLSVVNSGKFSAHPLNPPLRHLLSGISKLCWTFERLGVKLPKNRWTSPYLIEVAKR